MEELTKLHGLNNKKELLVSSPPPNLFSIPANLERITSNNLEYNNKKKEKEIL